jgi:hypothetical protein
MEATTMATKKTVLWDNYGYYAEVYTDDDNGSGCGDNPRIGRWYGSREDCERLDPSTVPLRPLSCDDSPDPFDLACERRHD